MSVNYTAQLVVDAVTSLSLHRLMYMYSAIKKIGKPITQNKNIYTSFQVQFGSNKHQFSNKSVYLLSNVIILKAKKLHLYIFSSPQ